MRDCRIRLHFISEVCRKKKLLTKQHEQLLFKLSFMNSICYTNTKHISYESKVTIHHLFSNFISEVYALDTNSYVKQEAAGKVDDFLQKRRKSEYVKTKECTEKPC